MTVAICIPSLVLIAEFVASPINLWTGRNMHFLSAASLFPGLTPQADAHHSPLAFRILTLPDRQQCAALPVGPGTACVHSATIGLSIQTLLPYGSNDPIHFRRTR